jgi:hypothetical protein
MDSGVGRINVRVATIDLRVATPLKEDKATRF